MRGLQVRAQESLHFILDHPPNSCPFHSSLLLSCLVGASFSSPTSIPFPIYSWLLRMVPKYLSVRVPEHQHASALGLKKRVAAETCRSRFQLDPTTCFRGPSLTWLSVRTWVGVQERQERPWEPAYPVVHWSTGFNSGFGLKDTWLSLLPRLQVGYLI